jgi:hypothetical protein
MLTNKKTSEYAGFFVEKKTSSKVLHCKLPVNQIREESLAELGEHVAVVGVVGMLPHVHGEQGFVLGGKGCTSSTDLCRWTTQKAKTRPAKTTTTSGIPLCAKLANTQQRESCVVYTLAAASTRWLRLSGVSRSLNSCWRSCDREKHGNGSRVTFSAICTVKSKNDA